MTCLSTEQIEQLAAGGLSGASRADQMGHIQECEACARLLEECRANLELMRELDEAFSTQQGAGWSGAPRSVSWDSFNSVRSERVRQTAVPHEPPSPDSIPGYQIIREIHRGGQGVVYEAVQHSTRRTVAVKVLLEGAFAGQRSRWRFEREVRLVAGLKHSNIVAIHDSGIAQGRYYFAMDYVRGQPLDTHVRLTVPPLRETLRLFVSICDAVSYAHRRGIIHRDLKPSNILVGEDGGPVVLDFGLAKIMAEERQESGRDLATIPGHVLGTVRYMSPEQTRGDLDAIDTRTDVYSLGVILYELLIGSPPYDTSGDLMAAFTNIRGIDPLRPSRLRRDITSDLDAIILKAMQKEPDRRYASAEQLKDDLVAWLDGRPVTARSDSTFYVFRKLAVKHSFETLVITTVLIVITSFTAIAMEQAFQKRRSEAARVISDRAALETREQLDLISQEELRPLMRRLFLPWFLLEWHQGRLEEARQVQSKVASDSPEHAAMAFLLDDTLTVDQLLADLPADAKPLVWFVAGERELKGGRNEAAVRFYQASIEAGGNGWFRSSAEARLNQLQAMPRSAGSVPEASP